MINRLKVYVAGPIESAGGNMNEPLFDYVTERLRTTGCEVFNPWELTRELIGPRSKINAMSKEERIETRKMLMLKEIAWIINQADVVYLLPGWETSDGAIAERAVALAIGKKISVAEKNIILPTEDKKPEPLDLGELT